MLLVVDIGNTNTVLGIYENKKLLTYWRMSTLKNRSADEIGILFMQFFQHRGIKNDDIKAAIISSVVPPIMHSFEQAIKQYINVEPLIVGPGTKTGMNIRYDNPKEVGADRIVNAVAGYELYGGPLILIDFGTATTFCAISEKGEYMGGVICPGIQISVDALFERTAKLPRIDLVKPETIIGKNTVHSMQAGAVYGYVGQVDYIVNRMKEEIKGEVKVVATGGLAPLIASESSTIDETNGLLTLEGLRIIYERNNR